MMVALIPSPAIYQWQQQIAYPQLNLKVSRVPVMLHIFHEGPKSTIYVLYSSGRRVITEHSLLS